LTENQNPSVSIRLDQTLTTIFTNPMGPEKNICGTLLPLPTLDLVLLA